MSRQNDDKKPVKHRREYRLEVRLLDSEREALQAYADARGVSMSEAVRDLIKDLIRTN